MVYYITGMKTIKLYSVTTQQHGPQFILSERPELNVFSSYAKNTSIKKLNMEQYFRGIDKNLMDYTKILYGPVYGMDDTRNGFIYEHNISGELLVVDEAEIPQTYKQERVIYADLDGIHKTIDNIPSGIITDYGEMLSISNMLTDPTTYNDLIRDEWKPNISFLLID